MKKNKAKWLMPSRTGAQ